MMLPLIKRISNFLEETKRLMISLSLIFLFVFFSVLSIKSYFNRSTVIDSFQVSPELAKRGYTNEFISKKIISEIHLVTTAANSYFSKEFPRVELNEDNSRMILLNETGVSSYLHYLFQFTDRRLHINGLASGDTLVNIVFSIGGDVIEVKGKGLDKATREAAISILEKVDPLSLAAYFTNTRDKRAISTSLVLLNDNDKSNDAFAYHHIGTAFLFAKEFKKARYYLKEALRLASPKQRAPMLNNFGVTYFVEPRAGGLKTFTDSAKWYYQQALKTDSTYYGSWLNISNGYASKGMFDSALIFSKRAMDLKPNDSRVLGFVGYHYYRTKDTTRAIDFLEKSTLKIPVDAQAYGYNLVVGVETHRENQDINAEFETLRELDGTADKAIFNTVKKYVSQLIPKKK